MKPQPEDRVQGHFVHPVWVEGHAAGRVGNGGQVRGPSLRVGPRSLLRGHLAHELPGQKAGQHHEDGQAGQAGQQARRVDVPPGRGQRHHVTGEREEEERHLSDQGVGGAEEDRSQPVHDEQLRPAAAGRGDPQRDEQDVSGRPGVEEVEPHAALEEAFPGQEGDAQAADRSRGEDQQVGRGVDVDPMRDEREQDEDADDQHGDQEPDADAAEPILDRIGLGLGHLPHWSTRPLAG